MELHPTSNPSVINVLGIIGETHGVITARAWAAPGVGVAGVYVQSWGEPAQYPSCVRRVQTQTNFPGPGGLGQLLNHYGYRLQLHVEQH